MKIEVSTDKPTVNKIVEAAIPLFAMRGVAAVSVKEVAEAAGVNIALISYYFGGKENLYSFILEQQLSVLDGMLETIDQEETCPVTKIKRVARAIVNEHRKHPYLDRLFYSEVTNPTKCFDSIVRKAADKLHRFLRECVVNAMSAGQFRSGLQPDFAAVSLIKILNLSFICLLLPDSTFPEGDPIACYTEQALEIYLRGVSKQPC